MFTGLVADIGKISALDRSGENWRVKIDTAFDTSTIELGESIAVDGACLTVTHIGASTFSVEASPETLRKTTLGARKIGHPVHLERALRVGDRLGGHLVLGHVDGVGTVQKRSREKNAWLLEVEAPESVAPYLVDKGSVTVDGVSLTVNWVKGPLFGLAIIPHTTEKTCLGDYMAGRRVNLEADVLGKYVRKFISRDKEGIDWAMLERFGFT
ncbi:MAG: riboflavin synthase [Bradymonadaceae bacterium]